MKNLKCYFPVKKILFTSISALSCIQSGAITDALKIKIAQGSYSDETVVRFLSGATGGFDGSYDAYKLFSSNPAVPNIFTKTTDGVSNLSVNAMPAFAASLTVDVYLRINTAGTYTISAEETGAFAAGACIMMKDLNNGALYYLRTTVPYVITLPVIAQNDPARFRVFFSYPASVQTTDASCSACNDGQVILNKPGETNWQYTILNSSLSVVASGTASSPVSINILGPGNYSVSFISDYTCGESSSFFIGPLTYYTRASGNWDDPSIWSTAACGGVAASSAPSSVNNVVICSGHSISVAADKTFKSLTIDGTITLTANLAISGDLVNNGTFNAGTYTVTLNGSKTQNISGTGNTALGSLVVNNSKAANAIILQAPVTVNGTLKLQDGHVITTSANVLTLGPSASVQLAAPVQDSSFIKGPMKHTVNVSSGVTKVFPVGKENSFRRIDLTVDQRTAATTTYMAELENNSAMALGYSLPLTLSNVSYVRYHTITQSPSSTKIDLAEVRIYFNCQGVDDAVENLGAMSVAKDNGSGSWLDLSDTPSGYVCTGTSYWGNALSGTFTSFAGNKFSLANTGGGSSLPVSLVQFDATAEGKTVSVQWSTASEVNCDRYVIERSFDGQTFLPAGTVRGNGNSSVQRNYVWKDDLPYQGVSFYRLKQIDNNGVTWYGDAASVFISEDEAITVFPNPAAESCFLALKNSKDAEVTFLVRNLNGGVCYSQTFVPDSDNELVKIDLADKNIAEGIYLFSIEKEGALSNKKVILKRN